jgi:CheY-like chemotaxis protein
MRVLIVEDDADAREMLRAICAFEGHAVSTACDGRAALDCLEAGSPPDVIVLDLMMPVMDGWAFRRAQRANPQLHDIPVITVSAVPDALRSVPELHPYASFPKPVDVPALLAAIDSLQTDRAAG